MKRRFIEEQIIGIPLRWAPFATWSDVMTDLVLRGANHRRSRREPA